MNTNESLDARVLAAIRGAARTYSDICATVGAGGDHDRAVDRALRRLSRAGSIAYSRVARRWFVPGDALADGSQSAPPDLAALHAAWRDCSPIERGVLVDMIEYEGARRTVSRSTLDAAIAVLRAGA